MDQAAALRASAALWRAMVRALTMRAQPSTSTFWRRQPRLWARPRNRVSSRARFSDSESFRRPYRRGKSRSEGGMGRTFSVRV